jgi:IS4 transposase
VRRCSVSSSFARFVFSDGEPRVEGGWAAGARALFGGLWRSEVDLRDAAVPGGFTRSGVLSPDLLVTLLLFMVADAGRHGYQSLLDAFWDEAERAGIDLPCGRAPSAASFCNARKKLRPQALRGMLRTVARGLLARDARRWRGLRVFAVDGSRLCVQRSGALWKTCGGPAGGGTPQVQVSTLFELFGEFPIDVEVDRFATSERAQALAHLDCLSPGDLLVLDRGYPGYVLLRELQRRGLHFAVRTPCTSTFPAVEAFLASDADDADIEIAPSLNFTRAHRGEEHPRLRLRAVRLRGPDGDDTVILTSLAGRDFPKKDIAQIYRRRWRIEEHYKLVKSEHFGQRQFHAKTLAGVAQEIYAQALLVVVTRSLTAAAQASPPADAMLPDARVHVKAAVAAVARRLVELMLGSDTARLAALLTRLRAAIHRRIEPLRRRRACTRRSFKPCSKWHANGRRGEKLR